MAKQPDHHDPRDETEKDNGEEEALFERIYPRRFFGLLVHHDDLPLSGVVSTA
jgi:hypothetical protein